MVTKVTGRAHTQQTAGYGKYRRAGNFREVIFSLYSRIVQIRETLTAKISPDAH